MWPLGVGRGHDRGSVCNAGRQTTLRDHVTVTGIGVHSGSPVTLTLHPAEADTGIVFLRSGIGGQPDRELKRQLPFRHGD